MIAAQEDDLDRAMEVMRSAFDSRWGEAWTRRQLSDAMMMPHTVLQLIAENGNAPADGETAAGFALSKSIAGEVELLLIAVRPEHRRSGLGGALLDDLIARANENGADSVFLEMRENNPALALYRQRGFAPVGRRKSYYRLSDGTFLDAVTFHLTL
ncbi:GNAT family N-acetyltransferase [Pseudopontixanthobacter vadosimaris]|uniref:GNAT family N-acetyltransferase n=1 Tax=Pseudopontixanthobacter vadosimaris TaxID=2726450 RepID=UPI001472CC34|nr:GNAT family N-acetyltransferase [Pseudopontixanthobacter vadosimaris]